LTPLSLFAEEDNFNPFPKNKSSIYQYKQDDIPDVCFFPPDKARWDGSKITSKEWGMLTDFQKASFISEYISELGKKYGKDIEINGWRWLIALNAFASNYEYDDVSMTKVIRELLSEQGKLTNR